MKTASILFKEIETDIVYEVQLFEEYALVRPATPGLETQLEKVDLIAFVKRFDEFWGNPAPDLAVPVVER